MKQSKSVKSFLTYRLIIFQIREAQKRRSKGLKRSKQTKQ